MKKKKKIILKMLLILILIILILKIFFLKKLSNIQKIDDFLFLKLFSKGTYNIDSYNNVKNVNEKEYKFKIDYKNMDFKAINLFETIDKETLIYEKIAPGTSGNFNILLESNQNLKYKIEFYSINQKPKNLNFKTLKDGILIGEADTLEELSQKLTGYISEDQKVNITIVWYWNFENNNGETDLQDTLDSQNIKRYQFNILTFGEELI